MSDVPQAFSSPVGLPTVSVVICTADRAESLDRTLQSLRQLRYERFEVVVVDGSRDGRSAEVAARHAGFIRYTTCPELNLSMSRNIGIAHARGDIVAFIDDDAIPEPDWLDLLLTGYDDPDVAQVGGFIRDNRGIDFQCRYVTVDRLGDGTHHEDLSGVELGDDRFLGLTGTNFSARRDRLLAIGGFDEEYAYFLDETDVTVRLNDRGWGAAIVPEAEIHHKYEASHMRTATRVPRTMYPQLRSKAYFCCVHGRRNHSLDAITDHLADLIEKERRWKTDLLVDGQADEETVARLIGEVERGAHDGMRDAFLYRSPRGMTAAQLEQTAQAQFHAFPLPLAAGDRLRICLLSQDYPPVGNGGIGQWTREMATGLAARGHEVTVICRSETDYPYIDFIDGVWVHRITEQVDVGDHAVREDVPAALWNYSASIEAEIRRIQDRRRFQVVCGPLFDLEPLAVLRRSGIPTVVSLQTTYRLALPHKPDWLDNASYRKNHVDRVIAKEGDLLANAPFILANTPGLIADLEAGYAVRLTPDRVTTIGHGIEDLARGIVPMPAAPDRVRLLFVGRLELRKGADILLDALPGLLRDHPQLDVDIVGDDQQVIGKDTLRRTFEERCRRDGVDTARVTFHGAVSREDLLRHYAGCDIFVAPSRYESFGLIFVEAMIFAKPVVGIAVGGVVDVVADGVNGLLIPRDDPAMLADALAQLIRDPERRRAMGRAGRAAYEEKFRMEAMIDASEAYFRKVAGH
ncbi:glycosyltransferase [Novosphingobium kaempferiae]|uniref:glycosyltransferase n=1 Tax=Novosphingobium kaempferiae TaxID=2896849 RepID=UPI001E658104|nr:glycosyltransferase [Novosphingobium kaempferiae]